MIRTQCVNCKTILTTQYRYATPPRLVLRNRGESGGDLLGLKLALAAPGDPVLCGPCAVEASHRGTIRDYA